jgi:dTDP-4-dehydrorhamnose reductase
MKPKSIAVIGMSGLVGGAIVDNLMSRKHHGEKLEVVGTYKHFQLNNGVYLDIEDFAGVKQFLQYYAPKIVFLAASNNNVDLCEINQNTNNINIWATVNVAEEANKLNIPVVYFSSGYVFDGTKQDLYSVEDEPNPINNFGKQKVTVENEILSCRKNLVIRTIGVFGREHQRKNFAYRVLDTISDGRIVYAPKNQTFNPIHSASLAEYAVQLALSSTSGLVHIAGNDCLTKFEFARKLENEAGIDDTMVQGVATVGKYQPAKRPSHCCLSSVRGTSADLLLSLDYGVSRFMREYDTE